MLRFWLTIRLRTCSSLDTFAHETANGWPLHKLNFNVSFCDRHVLSLVRQFDHLLQRDNGLIAFFAATLAHFLRLTSVTGAFTCKRLSIRGFKKYFMCECVAYLDGKLKTSQYYTAFSGSAWLWLAGL
jgi:hypothetical protein